MGDSSASGPQVGWELERKHIFVLSSSGKPIFSRYGDEQELVTTFGLLQAVISIVLDSGDSLRCIRAGSRRIVYFMKQSLYFVCISSTTEPEVVLLKQLNFLYNQILLVLTSKVHDVFKNNPAADIRQLLGPDTMRLMAVACEPIVTPVSVAMECLRSLTCTSQLREEIVLYLTHTVNESNAAYGILLHKDQIIACCPNASTQLNLSTSDIMLLTHFVANSKSLRSNDHNWVPLCMPDFNANGFLQAYISSFALYPEGGGDGAANTANNHRNGELTLILMASSADPDVFKELLRGKKYLSQTLTEAEMANKIFTNLQQDKVTADRYLESSNCLHFMFKFRPLLAKKGQLPADGNVQPLPTQYIESYMQFPLDEPVIQESILTQYQRLAICIRRGSSTVESTLFVPPSSSTQGSGGGGNSGSSSSGGSSSRKLPAPSAADRLPGSEELVSLFAMKNSTAGTVSSTSVKTARPGSVALPASGASNRDLTTVAAAQQGSAREGAAGASALSVQQSTDAAVQLLASLPSSDHALAYVVLSSGMIVVALATYDSELYVTFPGTITSLEASTTADLLSRTLRNDVGELFQVSQ